MGDSLVTCPICSRDVSANLINEHIDNSCQSTSADPLSSKKKHSSSSTVKNLAPIFSSPQPASAASSSQLSAKRPRAPMEGSLHSGENRAAKRTKQVHLETAMPLAEKLRPKTLLDFVGQRQITSLLAGLSNNPSIIFWGPPGCGKTTLSRLVAQENNSIFKELSATVVGINDVRQVFEEAKRTLALTGRRTTLFMDEIHRFNKAQQDIFLPYVEHGHIQLIGATTENPSFKLTAALISRCRVLVLERLSEGDIKTIVIKALSREAGTTLCIPNVEQDRLSSSSISSLVPILHSSQSTAVSDTSQDVEEFYPHLTPRVLNALANLSHGDARTALSLTELLINAPKNIAEDAMIEQLRNLVSTSFTTEDHYDMISALHKSIRGSQGSAAMYWLARMLIAGEDPMFICRRLAVCASEDIGLADNQALPLAMATMQACERIGMPECRINLAHLVSYLSEAPKSTRSYEAYNAAEAAAKSNPSLPVPMQVRNAPTGLMKDLGYGEEYKYNPSFAHPVYNTYIPDRFSNEVFLKNEIQYREGRVWDEDALQNWENCRNSGKRWEGRPSNHKP